MQVKGVTMIRVQEVRSIGLHPESKVVVGVPVAKITKVEPTQTRQWNEDCSAVIDGEGKSVIRMSGDLADIYVTETVEEIIKLINTPLS
jgi:hypothetical protein